MFFLYFVEKTKTVKIVPFSTKKCNIRGFVYFYFLVNVTSFNGEGDILNFFVLFATKNVPFIMTHKTITQTQT